MATLRIAHDEYRNGGLPPICMACGEPADEFEPEHHHFTYTPTWLIVLLLVPWIGIILFVIGLFALHKRRRLETPFCEEHRGYWFFRNWTNWAVFFSFLGMLGSWVVLGYFNAPGLAYLAVMAVFAMSYLFAAVFQHSSIRAGSINDCEMKLVNVSLDFRDAVHRDRESEVVELIPYRESQDRQFFGESSHDN